MAAVSEVTPEISSILDQMHSIQISQEERRVMSVNASQDAAQIFHTYSGTTTSHHAQHHGSSSTINPTKSQPSSSGTKYKRSSSSLLRSSHESNWNDQAPASHNDSDCHGEEHFLPHCQADDDYSYALNLHMGVLGEVFGRSLTELQASSTDSHPVPDIVLDCLLFLLHNSLSIEGIFRISGDDDTIADLRRSYDEGKSHSHYRNATAASITESHDIASLIKYYLRLLPDPLFPKKSYRFLTETLQLPESEYLSQMKIFLSPHDGSETNPILPEKLCITNLKVLSYLFFVLHQITLHTEENKMTGDNLAIIFAPSLLCPEGSQELGLYELQNGIAIMKRLLEYCEEIFNPLWNEYPLEVVK